MKLEPLHDLVLIELVSKNVTPGGIIRPESADANENHDFIVRAVGPGRQLESGDIVPCSVKAGDHVVLTQSPHPFRDPDDGRHYCMVRDQVIAAKVVEPAKEPSKIIPSKNGAIRPLRPS